MNTIDHTIFHLELDEIRNNSLRHNYSSSIAVSYTGGDVPFIDFDSYKGSFLHLKSKESVKISPKSDTGIILKNKTDYAFNFYFCYEKKNSRGALSIITINDEISIRAEKYERINALVIYQGNERVFVLKNNTAEVNIRQNRWYNITVSISPDENKKSVVAILLDGVAVKLTGTLSNLTSISKITLGGNDEGDVLKIGDFYLLKDAANEIPEIIKKGINPNLKLDWINSLGFDLFSKQNGTLKKGIYLNNDLTDFLLKISTSHQFLKLIPDQDQYHIVLKFKKGLINTMHLHESKAFKYEDSGTDILLYCKLEEGKDVILPDLEFINLSGQPYAFVQCQLQYVTVETDSYAIRLTEPLFLDKQIDLYDLRGSMDCPFEVFILGDGVLLNDDKTSNKLKLRLYNVSDEQLCIPAPDANNRTCRFTLMSDRIRVLKPDTLQKIKITVPDFSHRRNDQDTLSVEIMEEVKINPKGFIDILFENLIATNPSVDYPSGNYTFHLKYENIKNYVNGKIPFFLKTGRISSRWEENKETHHLNDFSSIQSQKATITSLSTTILELKDKLELLTADFKISLQGKEMISITEREVSIQNRLKVNNEFVSMPIGAVIAYAGNVIPDGWLICDGKPIPETYKRLRELMDLNKYCSPDLTGRFILGDNGSDKRINNHPRFTGGKSEVVLSEAQIPHPQFVKDVDFELKKDGREKDSGFGRTDYVLKKADLERKTYDVQQANNNPAAVNIIPPYYRLLYIIKAQ